MNTDKKGAQKSEKFGNKETKQKNPSKAKPGNQTGNKSNLSHSSSRDM